MAKFSKKVMGKEVGSADIYAAPHTMKGKAMSSKDAMMAVSRPPDPNTLSSKQMTPGGQPSPRVSMGDPNRDDVKTTGIKIRGTGAATKGVMARGPMA
jgi:hypothetical protein